MEFQEIVHSVDVRIHNRVWNAQKNLLQTLDKELQRFIESIVVSLTIQ